MAVAVAVGVAVGVSVGGTAVGVGVLVAVGAGVAVSSGVALASGVGVAKLYGGPSDADIDKFPPHTGGRLPQVFIGIKLQLLSTLNGILSLTLFNPVTL